MNGYPRLYIGVDFIRQLKVKASSAGFSVHHVNREDLSEFISYYSTVPKLKNPLVIEDISTYNEHQQSILLKFIEDTELKVILLASEDNILSTILSRMSLVYKQKEKISSSFYTPLNNEAQIELSKIDSNSNRDTYIRKQVSISPVMYYYDQLLEDKNNKAKLLRILARTNQDD